MNRTFARPTKLSLTAFLLFLFAACTSALAQPCAQNPASRQFDFWLGNWSVSAPGSGPTAASKVVLSLDQCLIVETWDGGRGHSGQNTFAYSPEDKNWYGMFADNDGRVHIFTEGKVSSGAAEFRGSSRSQTGDPVLNRVRIVRLSANKIEQTWEKSTDNGANWTAVFRGEYSRSEK
ncbi:MAG TPA: hypothetical protein VND65_05450 [Candidatus Binatia bacterium]|nr:hypothetical protein [Candidatus Binatia bacterium]